MPSALSFSVTELLMASTSESNCCCVMPGGTATGAWAYTVVTAAHRRLNARTIERNADIGFPFTGKAAARLRPPSRLYPVLPQP